jgi:predicted nucleotidyltransferase component of viral defense system
MDNLTIYTAQVNLLLEVLPVINQHKCFALKGGTAINLFVRDMPRLSVDIDLTYLPIEGRNESLNNIQSNLKNISNMIQEASNYNFIVKEIPNVESQLDTLHVLGNNARIIIEVNPVVRGSVFGCEERSLCKAAQDKFLTFCKIQTLSLADLYGSKICAALGRHKPRDLFDVMLLLENEGIPTSIRQAFIIYLASTNRPIHELLTLEPNLQNLEAEYKSDLEGMTIEKNITVDDLKATMNILISKILDAFTPSEREFLIAFKSGVPQWNLLPIDGIQKLPALQWKLKNINALKINSPKKHQESLYKLQKVLDN